MNISILPNHGFPARPHAVNPQQRPIHWRLPNTFLRASFAVVLALGALEASAATIKDSAEFGLKQEMEGVPSPIYLTSKGCSSDGDVLTFNNAQNGDGAFGWTGELVNSKGYTIEIRYQITEVNTAGTANTTAGRRYTFQFQGADGSGTRALNVIHVGMPVVGSELGLYTGGHTLGFPISSGEWHTLRIAEEANNNDMLVWSDGVEVTGVDWQSGNNTVNRAWFGDLGVNVTDGVYNVDYFRVDKTGAYAPPAPVAPVVAHNPQSITNVLGARIILAAEFSGLVSGIQWFKDSVLLDNATRPAYVIDAATLADEGWYFARATNALGFAETIPAYVKVLDVDPTPPAVQSVQSPLTLQNVRVTYTKPMAPETATDIANYGFQGNALTVLLAKRIDQYTVELATTFQTPGASYTLLIANVLDTLSNPIAPNTSVSFAAPMLNPCVRYDAGTTASQPSGPSDPAASVGGSWAFTPNTNAGMSVLAVTDDLSSGFNAWSVTDQNVLPAGGVLDYRMVIDQASDNLAHANGWRLLVRSRLADNFFGSSADQIMLYSDTGLGKRYGVFFAMDGSGNLTATLLGGFTYTLTSDSTSYHTHALIYDPVSDKLSYYFDGQSIVTNYVGQTTSGYNGVAFGAASAAGTGQMNYNLVQFDVVGATAPVVTANPPSTTYGVGQKVTFTAGFTPFVGAYQWLSNNVVLVGATNASYTTDFITEGYNGSQYICRALHALGNVETSPATLTVTTDVAPPTVVAVKGSLLFNRVIITYSEPVQAAYAANPANYVWLQPGVTNISAVLLDPVTVELRTTPQAMGSNYTVRISNVRDGSNLTITPNTAASFTTQELQTLGRYDAGSTTTAPGGAPDPVSPAGGAWALLLNNDPGLTTNAVTDDLGTGWNAWQVSDQTSASGQFIQYGFPFSANQLAAPTNGWVFTTRARFVDNFGSALSLYCQYSEQSTNRFLFYVDLDENQALRVTLSGGGGGTFIVTGEGIGRDAYHLHQVVYDPTTRDVSYYFDGGLIKSGWTGLASTGLTPGVIWGAGSSAGQGSMNFNLVDFNAVQTPLVPSVHASRSGAEIQIQYVGVLESAAQVTGPYSGIATNISGTTNTFIIPPGGQPSQQFFRARTLAQ